MTPLMIAPAAATIPAGPAADTTSTDSGSDSGASFANVLAEVPGSDSAAGTGAGRPNPAGRDKSDSDQPGADPADPASSVAVLTLAGTVLPLSPLRPVSAPAGSAAGAVSAAAAGNAASPVGLATAGSPITGGVPATEVGVPTQPAGASAGSGAAGFAATGSVAALASSSAATSGGTAQSATTAQSPLGNQLGEQPPASAAQPESAGQTAAGQATAGQATAVQGTPAQPVSQLPGTTTQSEAKPAVAGIGQPVGQPLAPQQQLGSESGAGSHSGNSDSGNHAGASRPVSSRDASTVRTEFSPIAEAPLAIPPANQPVAGQPIVAHQPSVEPVSAPAASLPNVPTHDYPAVAQPMTHQLAGPVLGLRAGGDASHQLSIALHPADLGAVSVHVRITGDAMTIQLASASEGAHAAIRDALPQLRQELQSAGLSGVEVSLDLATGSSAGQSDSRQAGQGPGHSGAAPPATELPDRLAVPVRTAGTGNTGLDRWL